MTPAKRLEDRVAALPAFLRAQPRVCPAARIAAMPTPQIDRPDRTRGRSRNIAPRAARRPPAEILRG
jgi:hypothetical protein